ncbi:MAG: hypothetical protein ACRCWM_01310 [Sarcina sp.]
MNLDELKGMEDAGVIDDSLTDRKMEISKAEKEELCRKLTNKILDSNPDIVENFNNGNITAIDDTVLLLKEKVDFDISDEALNNIVGEEILTR